MIKEFAFIGSILSMYSATPVNNKNFQHTEEIAPNTEVTYKYESNEVTSQNDIILGNLYEFNITNDIISTFVNSYSGVEECYFIFNFVNITSIDFNNLSTNVFIDELLYGVDNLELVGALYCNGDLDGYFWSPVNFFNDYFVSTYLGSLDYSSFTLTGYGFFSEISNITFKDVSFISYTDYNEIVSVEYIPPQTFIGVINEFCETYLFSEIPYINQIQFTVGGQQISMMTYCVIFVGLATAIGLLILLFVFLKWLFYLFGGCFHIRK